MTKNLNSHSHDCSIFNFLIPSLLFIFHLVRNITLESSEHTSRSMLLHLNCNLEIKFITINI